jgi:hypothetical protein
MKTIFENKSNSSNAGAQAGTNAEAKDQLANQLELVKRQVFTKYKGALAANEQLLRLALFEADVLARQTGFPQLFFPVLATEKAESAARWQSHQRYLLRSNSAYAHSPYALAA